MEKETVAIICGLVFIVSYAVFLAVLFSPNEKVRAVVDRLLGCSRDRHPAPIITWYPVNQAPKKPEPAKPLLLEAPKVLLLPPPVIVPSEAPPDKPKAKRSTAGSRKHGAARRSVRFDS